MVFQWDDYVALKILKIKAEIRDANKKIGRKVKSKSVDERGTVPLGSRRWTPLLERWFLSLNLRTLGGGFGCADGGRTVCSWVRDEAGRCYRKNANEGEDIYIYYLYLEGKVGI